jgi:peptide/nickel transport system substrate-binding protein
MARRQEHTLTDRRRYLQLLGLGGASVLAGCSGGDSGSDGTGDGSSDGGSSDGSSDGGSGDGSSDGGSDGEDSSTETAGGIQRGGHLRLAFNIFPQSLHPMEGTSGGDMVLREAAVSRLTRLDQSLAATPDLATEWESNDANDEWTFMLTEDAVFSNTGGRSVLAEDVEATIEMMQEEPDSAKAGDLGALESVEVEDDHRITLKLEGPDLLYPKKIAEADSRFVILPKNVIEDRRDELTETDFGSGPFVISEFKPNDSLAFEAHDDYHLSDEEGNALPYVDQVTWKLTVDPTAQLNALLDKRVDALQFTAPSQMKQLSETDGVNAERLASTSFISIVLNTTVETESGDRPFADPKVRKAMKHATDLEGMVAATDDKLEITHHGPVTPAHQYYPDFDEGLEFGITAQPDEARRLLEEAGYGDGLQLPTMYYSADNSPSRGPTSVLFQEQMSKVGIEFDIQRLTGDVWLSEYWNKDGVWYASGYAGRLVDSTVHNLALHTDAPWNSARWSNEEYDAAHERMSNATTLDEFAQALAEAERIHHLDGGWIVTGAEVIMAASRDYVQNVAPLPTQSVDYHYNDWLTSDAPEGP